VLARGDEHVDVVLKAAFAFKSKLNKGPVKEEEEGDQDEERDQWYLHVKVLLKGQDDNESDKAAKTGETMQEEEKKMPIHS